MRRIVQFCSASILLSLCTLALADEGYDYAKEDLSGYDLQPTLKIENDSVYARTGNSVYFFGGYIFTHRLLNTSTQTFSENGVAGISYVPKSTIPQDFSGMQIGVGKEWTHHIDLQLTYIDDFQETKSSTNASGTPIQYSAKMNGLLGNIGYVFNPQDQVQIIGQLGVMLSEFTNQASITTPTVYYPVGDTTKIDPDVGVEFLFQGSKHTGLFVNGRYVADLQNQQNSHGQFDLAIGLNYFV